MRASVLGKSEPESKERVRALVSPILEKLRALTSALTWPDVGGQPELQPVFHRMNRTAQTFTPRAYPVLNARLDRDGAVAFFKSSHVNGRLAAAQSALLQDAIWPLVEPVISSMAVTVDMWETGTERTDERDWLAKRLGKPFAEITANDYVELMETLAPKYAASLDQLLPIVRQESVLRLHEALLEFLGLPFWKDRWFLYELWTLCHVLTLAAVTWPVELRNTRRRKDNIIEWHLPGGSARAPVAVIGENAEIELWTQRKTAHPAGGKGLEPDLRITRSGPNHPDLFIIENKDRRKPRKQEIEEILRRYVSGTTASCVCLVNYEEFTGPTHDLTSGVPGTDVIVVSRFRPPDLPAEFERRLLRVLNQELAGTRHLAAAPAGQLAEYVEVTLEWQKKPDDLDLHVWLERAEGAFHISFKNKGAVDVFPYAVLPEDVKAAPGRETVKMLSKGLRRTLIAVHRFSHDGALEQAQLEVRIDGTAGGPHVLSLPNAMRGSWWHVATLEGDLLPVTLLGVVSDEPPIDTWPGS
jgi:hypothetical protein